MTDWSCMDYDNGEQPGQPGKAQPFVTSTTKFIAMSLCTFGVYELYWSYKNWRYVKDHRYNERSTRVRTLDFA